MRVVRISAASIICLVLVYLSQLQFGTINVGQEFGVYGDYNRVRNLVEEIEELELVNSRVRRRLHLDFFSSVSNFGVTVENANGDRAVLNFDSGSPVLEETSREELREIIVEEAELQFISSF